MREVPANPVKTRTVAPVVVPLGVGSEVFVSVKGTGLVFHALFCGDKRDCGGGNAFTVFLPGASGVVLFCAEGD